MVVTSANKFVREKERFMKHLLPEEYRNKSIAAIIVIAAGILIYMVSQRLSIGLNLLKPLLTTLKPVFIGIGIAYLLSPLLRRTELFLQKKLCKKKQRTALCRALGVVVCYILFLAVVAALLGVVMPQVVRSLKAMVNLLLRFINANAGKMNDFLLRYGFISAAGDDFVIAWEGIINQAMGYVTALLSNALTITQWVYSFVLTLVVAVSIYSLFEKEKFGGQVKKVMYSIFSPDTCASIIFWMRRSNRVFSGFISGKIYDSMIMGVLCYVCMRIFKMEFPELISCIFGITNIVPFFGPIVGGVIGTLLLLIVNPTTAIWFAVMALVLQQLDGNIIGPHILGETIGLSAFWIMLAILVGGGMFGFPGMLLGAPIFAIVYALVKAFVDFRLEKRGLPRESARYINAPTSLNLEEEHK